MSYEKERKETLSSIKRYHALQDMRSRVDTISAVVWWMEGGLPSFVEVSFFSK